MKTPPSYGLTRFRNGANHEEAEYDLVFVPPHPTTRFAFVTLAQKAAYADIITPPGTIVTIYGTVRTTR